MIPEKIQTLVNTFEMNLENYKSRKERKETEIRKDYIDPLFELMGWNIRNEGLAEYEKEVAAEYSVKDKTGKKKADYCFKLNGNPMFFVEAKDPYINIHENKDVAFQLRSYCWNAKVPVGILTDFEEFAIYDGRYEPKAGDSANVARIHYFKYTEYKDNWEKIAGLFSKKAVASGALNNYINTVKVKRGILTIDEAFLKDMESWREILAVNITSLNPELNRKEINFAVQRTIDRIVFLRICEDRDIEPYENIKNLTAKGNIYKGLIRLFKEADKRYNSGIFYFKEEKARLEGVDTFTPGLKIDDESLKKIIERLYYPSPYNFAVMPADILGHIYERFLGKVISLTPERVVTVEEKPEVRKAGGVYYTPTYIVDYIVKNTIGKLIEGKTPDLVEKLKFLDPACGSGSFLIHAYQYLLDWHLNWYITNNADKYLKGKKAVLVKDRSGNIRLKIDVRKRILLNNIFGVDIDFQAVEVTKLSLLLKVLEGEDDFTIQQGLFKERALPDLGKNIKCGNSLIGSDFYHGKQISLISPEEQERINTFDWDSEFPNIMKAGGFDAVIGNPPYLRIQGLQENYSNQITYYIQSYKSAVKRFDLYLLFLEKGYGLLNKNGVLGFINPHKFINSDFGSGIRSYLTEKQALSKVISFGNNLIFSQASTYTGLFFLTKKQMNTFLYYEMKEMPCEKVQATLNELKENDFSTLNFSGFDTEAWVLSDDIANHVILKLNNQKYKAKDIFQYISQGIVSTGDDIFYLRGEVKGDFFFGFSDRLQSDVKLESKLIKPIMKGEDVKKYTKVEPVYYVIFPYYETSDKKTKPIEEKEVKELYPLAYNYLKQFKEELTEKKIKYKTNPKYWYGLHRSREIKLFESNKIITPEISIGCNMTIDIGFFYHNTQVYSIIPNPQYNTDIKFCLGILNSKIFWWYLTQTGTVLRGGYFRFKTKYIEPFPMPKINLNDSSAELKHDQLITLVNNMLSLNKQFQEANHPQSQTIIQRQIESTDSQIDQLVYKLYDLTEEEIRIVED